MKAQSRNEMMSCKSVLDSLRSDRPDKVADASNYIAASTRAAFAAARKPPDW